MELYMSEKQKNLTHSNFGILDSSKVRQKGTVLLLFLSPKEHSSILHTGCTI